MRFREVPFIQDDPNAGPEVKHATVTPTARAIHIDVTDWWPTPVCLKKSKLWFNHFHPWFSRKLVVRRKNSRFLCQFPLIPESGYKFGNFTWKPILMFRLFVSRTKRDSCSREIVEIFSSSAKELCYAFPYLYPDLNG